MRKLFKIAQKIKKSSMYPYGSEPEEEEEEEYVPDMPSPGDEMARYPGYGENQHPHKERVDTPDVWTKEHDVSLTLRDVVTIAEALRALLGQDESNNEKIKAVLDKLTSQVK